MTLSNYQNHPGDDIVDLRNVLVRYEDEKDTDGQEQDTEYIEQVDDLMEQFGNWEHAIVNEPVLIADSYFEQYAQQYAEGIGAVEDSARWPANRIDWEEAASDLQMDFAMVDFGGVEYWTRS